MDTQIYKSSGSSFPMVQRWNMGVFETALNWRSLVDEAMVSIEPELRRRWLAYWQENVACASIAQSTTDVRKLMSMVKLPSEYYYCPPELARKAIWPSSNEPSPQLFIEAVKTDGK